MTLPKDQLEQNQGSTGYLLRRLTGYNPWAVCLLIGSFVPIPRVPTTLVTCEVRPAVVKSAPLPKDLRVGPSASAEVGRAHKSKSISVRVMDRLQQAEAHESEPFYQQHIRQAWIILSLLQKGVSNPFVLSSYTIYGKHPEDVWPAIVADRKARLCDEYFTWYTSDDVLRPDVPKIPHNTADADTHAANGASSADWERVGLVPQERKLV